YSSIVASWLSLIPKRRFAIRSVLPHRRLLRRKGPELLAGTLPGEFVLDLSQPRPGTQRGEPVRRRLQPRTVPVQTPEGEQRARLLVPVLGLGVQPQGLLEVLLGLGPLGRGGLPETPLGDRPHHDRHRRRRRLPRLLGHVPGPRGIAGPHQRFD